MTEAEGDPCKYCTEPTYFEGGTGLCNNCWEVESRLKYMPKSILLAILRETKHLTVWGRVR
jgi:hypothetical protein